MLNESIQAYLNANGVAWSPSDYTTGIPEGGEDQILFWDEGKLGPQPSMADLDAAYQNAEIAAIKAANKKAAMEALQATDWVEIPSVSDPSISPHLLNKADFMAVRCALRAIAVNPPGTSINLPEVPQEVWG